MLGKLGEVTQELRIEGTHVRYLGSTIVPDDEACFCQFEGASAAAVAEANERAGVPFARIVAAVTVETGRVRPNLSFDTSASLIVLKTAKQRVRLQADLVNLANRLNVIDFAGLFSGTALAPPRSVAARLQVDF
jgi:outer membrane receptor for Fe3+-dicitrate